MSRNDELMAELRQALTAETEARVELESNRSRVVESKSRWHKARARVEEIEREIATGNSGRPILDAIVAGNGSAPEIPAATGPKSTKRRRVAPVNTESPPSA